MSVQRYIQQIEVEVCGNPDIVEREKLDPIAISEIIEEYLKAQGVYVPVKIVAKASAWDIGGPRARMVIGRKRTPANNDIQAHEEVCSIIKNTPLTCSAPCYPSSSEIDAVYYAIERGLDR